MSRKAVFGLVIAAGLVAT